jgi:hypothetical protein
VLPTSSPKKRTPPHGIPPSVSMSGQCCTFQISTDEKCISNFDTHRRGIRCGYVGQSRGGVLTGCNSTDSHMHDQSGNLTEFRIVLDITSIGDPPHSFPTPTNPKLRPSVGSSPPVTPVVEAPRECEHSFLSDEGRGNGSMRLPAVPTLNTSLHGVSNNP